MSSPITFSGFNNIDFNLVLNALMQQASQPLTALQDRQKALRSQITGFDTLNSHVSSLQSAAEALASLSSISTLSAMTGDNAISATVTDGATTGHHDVVVTEIARAQVTASTSVAPDATTTVVATGGTLTIGGVDVAVGQSMTLQDLASAINATTGIGVTAAVIRTATNAYRLTLTSNLTGAANGFTIANGLTGGAGVTFGDADQNGVSGDSAADNAVSATDAAILLNNIPVTSASNSFDDVMPGVTITVSRKDAAKVIELDITEDTASLTGKIEDFITAYNNVVKFLDAQRVAAGRGDAGSIGREPVARQLRNALRSVLTGAHGSAAYTRLSEVGIEFTAAGTLQLNRARLDDGLRDDPAALRSLFAASGGAFPAIDAALDDYADQTGLISSVKDRLARQISLMDDQITSLQSRLAIERASLQRQFTEADAAMSRLNSQSGSLASLGQSFGSF